MAPTLEIILALFGIHSTIDTTQSLKVFNCDSDSLCSSVNICPPNEDCLINCIGSEACKDKTFQCPSNGQCLIQCGTNINDTKSCYQTLFTTKPDTKIISITTRGTNTMAYSTVFCPSFHNMDNNNCFIYSMDGHSQLSNIHIYTTGSIHNVQIYCEYPSKCYNTTQYPIIHCLDYTSSCNLHLTSNSYNEWQCINDNSICQQIPTQTPTNTPTNTPTFSPTITPYNSLINTTSDMYDITSTNRYNINNSYDTYSNTPNPDIIDNIYIDEDGKSTMAAHMEAVIMASIFAASFCFLFVIVCMITIYLKKSKSDSMRKDSNIMDVDDDQEPVHVQESNRRASNLPKPKPRIPLKQRKLKVIDKSQSNTAKCYSKYGPFRGMKAKAMLSKSIFKVKKAGNKKNTNLELTKSTTMEQTTDDEQGMEIIVTSPINRNNDAMDDDTMDDATVTFGFDQDLTNELHLMIRDRKNKKGKASLSKPPSCFSSRQVSELSIAGKCKKCFHRPGPFHVDVHKHQHLHHQHHTCQHDGDGEALTIPIERTD